MKLEIRRFKEIKDGTIGEFALIKDMKILVRGYTLEPAGNDTVEANKDRRIPEGKYHIAWHTSTKFKRTLPVLFNQDVSKDRFILIHAGNYPKDTEGCILLGNKYDDNGIYNSKATLEAFLAETYKENFTVEIRNKI
jgi:hypothetical protein